MPGTELVLVNQTDHLNQSAVERMRAAFWSLEFIGWVAEFGFDNHAAHLYHLIEDAANWAMYWEIHGQPGQAIYAEDYFRVASIQ